MHKINYIMNYITHYELQHACVCVYTHTYSILQIILQHIHSTL